MPKNRAPPPPVDKDNVMLLDPIKGNFRYWQNLHQNKETLVNVQLVTLIQNRGESALNCVLKEERKQQITKLGDAHLKSLLFQAEATLKLKSHANVVKTMRTFHTQSRVYFLMEYAGYSLDRYQLKGLREDKILKEIASGILTGLIYLHDNKVSHRNMHPENIYIDYRNQVKIGGFRGARPIPKSGKMNTFVGTVPYMAPEMLKSNEKVRKQLKPIPAKTDGYDEKIDVWGLALILLYILLGKNYFEALQRDEGTTEESALEIIREICSSRESVVGLKIPALDNETELKEFLKYMLVRDPKIRFAAKDLKVARYLSTYDGVPVQKIFGEKYPALQKGEECVGFREKFECKTCENYNQFDSHFKSTYQKQFHVKKCDFCRHRAREYVKPKHYI
ncbi:Calcium-dependent protein kinase 4 [Cichlidogyrus casuarinus]|uniref:Calcium-dependent protein kinase 4 n=1 Tax=Cichlidogyrus casuarinus TaxID=1844966 RepID=A0ABD2PSK2_9PLAT